MRTINKIIAMAFVLMMVLAPVMVAAQSEGDVDPTSTGVQVNSFDDMSGGSIDVTIAGDATKDYTVSVKDESGNQKASTVVKTGSDGKATAHLSWNFGSSGDKIVNIYIDDKLVDGGIKISVSHSIWKDPLTYVAIVVVIILIVIAVYLKMRGLPGKKKDKKDKTFTQIEEERKSGEKKSFFSKKAEEKPADIVDDTTSTEKKEYTPGKGFFRKKQ